MRAPGPALPVIATILLIALSGCVAIDELRQHLDSEAAAAAPPKPRTKPQHAVPPPAPRPKPEIARLAAPASRPAAPPAFDPESLIGMKPAQAIAALGDPASVQERSPSMVWRYNARGCALDLFFYMDLGANAFRVLAYDLKSGAASGADAGACRARPDSSTNGR